MTHPHTHTARKPLVSRAWFAFPMVLAAAIALPQLAIGQTGVSDDRVSLPEGPGSIEGVGENVEIDPNMGSMQYSVPISVPQGINGMTPQMGLNYSSAGGSSVVGVGWSMPMQSIERMTSRGTPEYDPEDYFAANGGDELVLVGGNDTSQVYRERFEGSFIRYTWHNVGDGAEGYWTAEYPDGSVAYYGADSQGNLVDSARSTRPSGGAYKYHMVEKLDPYGNAIKYEYTELSGNWPLLSQISYAFEGETPIYRIKFGYGDRDDFISDAGAGYEELLEYRLEDVQVIARGTIVREYDLNYEDYATSGGFTRLTKVTRYGLGGKAMGPKYPIEFTFGYSEALGATCIDGMDCNKPFVQNMEKVTGASGLTSGTATLMDINADGLPDVVDTTGTGAHRIFMNRFELEGANFKHVFGEGSTSSLGEGNNFALGNEVTQVLDVNGDGLSDLVNSLSGNTLLGGYGGSDWAALDSSLDTDKIRGVDITQAKFIDYNNDKRIDLMTSTGTDTIIYENMGDEFKVVAGEGIDVTFDSANTAVQLADMNGDGINDVVEILSTGFVRYRLNYGWGKWSGWRSATGIEIDTSELDKVDLEDLNGDGISDIVIVLADVVKYAINRNGTQFDDFEFVRTANLESGQIPQRSDGDKVLYADMNANGSADIVWFDSQGQVQYLEVFPTRPNLLTRIENGIGMVQTIEYTTSAEQEALARENDEAWEKSLSIPMNVVKSTDTWVTLTGDDTSGRHERVTYTYRDGFYDGVEKQFRGFEHVRMEVESSESQEGGVTTYEYSVGRDKPHFNGLMLRQQVMSGARILNEVENTYEECGVRDVPSEADLLAEGRFAVKFPCQTKTVQTIKEGLADAAWITTEQLSTYDDQGNVIESVNMGVVGEEGDELYETTTFYKPGDGDAWFLKLPLTSSTTTVESGDRTEINYYYDGADFVGSQSEVTHGFMTRMTERADASTVIETQRQKRDEYGNVVETIDPNGSIADEDSHRRRYIYTDNGLFLTYVDVHVSEGHKLRRSTRYEENFQKQESVTDWVLIQDDEEVSPRNETRFTYDDFGRMLATIKPGDDDATPSVQYEYELGDPFTRITVKTRGEMNGPITEMVHQCYDGRGRQYQSRARIADGRYVVGGFQVLNSRGATIEAFQPYESSAAECQTIEDVQGLGIESTTYLYDAQFRELEMSAPGEDLYGERLLAKTVYEPLKTLRYDSEDLDEQSPHFDTPTVRQSDGLGRLRRITRQLAGGESANYDLFYDQTNSFSGYADPEGNRHELSVDLANRVVAVTDPTTGTITFEYDDAGNVLTQKDARGVEIVRDYDGANRLIGQWDAADKDGTQMAFFYDELPEGCSRIECTNVANRLAQITYPSIFGQTSERFGYDARQRVIFQARRFGNDIDLWTKVSFDNLDRVDVIDYADGLSLDLDYDGAGRLKSVSDFIDEIEYTERSLPGAIKYANGAVVEKRYDVLMRLESLFNKDGEGQIIDGMLFDYNREGHITAVQDMSDFAGPTHDARFDYDAWYRVTGSTQQTAGEEETVTYGFDNLDRITGIDSSLSEQSSAHMGQMTYDDQRPHVLKRAGELDFEFDAAGQLSRRGDLELEWDYLNRITRFVRGDEVEDHVYGADKDRVAIRGEDRLVFYGFNGMEVRDGISSTYIRHESARLAKSRGLGMSTMIYGDENDDGEITSADAWLKLDAGSSDSAVSPKHVLAAAAETMLQRGDEERVFFHADHLGSLIAATDEGGDVIGRRAYNMTGMLRHSEGMVDHYGFTGQEHNPFSGLIQFKMRDLDPQTGRWTSFDPQFIKLDAGAMSILGEATSAYAYIGGDFASATDPLGLNKNGGKGQAQVPGPKEGRNKAALNAQIRGMKGATGTKDGQNMKPSDVKMETTMNKLVSGMANEQNSTISKLNSKLENIKESQSVATAIKNADRQAAKQAKIDAFANRTEANTPKLNDAAKEAYGKIVLDKLNAQAKRPPLLSKDTKKDLKNLGIAAVLGTAFTLGAAEAFGYMDNF